MPRPATLVGCQSRDGVPSVRLSSSADGSDSPRDCQSFPSPERTSWSSGAEITNARVSHPLILDSILLRDELCPSFRKTQSSTTLPSVASSTHCLGRNDAHTAIGASSVQHRDMCFTPRHAIDQQMIHCVGRFRELLRRNWFHHGGDTQNTLRTAALSQKVCFSVAGNRQRASSPSTTHRAKPRGCYTRIEGVERAVHVLLHGKSFCMDKVSAEFIKATA